jgi:hypothetical protein
LQIERITKEEEAIGILKLDDPQLKKQVLDKQGMTAVEWVQWIEGHLNDNDGNFMRLWAVKEGGMIKAYMIMLNTVVPPVSRACYILYQCFFGMTDEEGEPYHRELIRMARGWAKECGARKKGGIAIQTDYPHVNERLGFYREGYSMVMDLE